MPFLSSLGFGGVTALLTKIGSFPVVAGGALSEDTNYFYRTFTGSGTLRVTEADLTADILVVAGGGGGGCGHGGGGGAGGYRTLNTKLSPGTYTVTIGAGGAGSSSDSARAASGSNSVFNTLTSAGGGGGGSRFQGSGAAGGSGGGGSFRENGAAGNTPSTTPPQGNNGGNLGVTTETHTAGGGGGGAGAVGAPGINFTGGAGGVGTQWLNGSFYAGGGGGGGYGGSGGAGGNGGGGAGGTSAGSPATAYTGGGGGGGAYDGAQRPGAAGGSGIVILRYSKKAVNAETIYDFVEIAHFDVLNPTTSITFDLSDIGTTYEYLQLRSIERSTVGSEEDSVSVRFNGDTGSNYGFQYVWGNTSTLPASTTSSATRIYPFACLGNSATANTFGHRVMDIYDAFNTSKNTTIRSFNGYQSSTSRVAIASGVWRSTAAVTSMTISPDGGQWVVGSSFTLYGWRNGSE